MNDKPLVTVIIPTHNRAELLKRAVKSVLNQTYRNLEIIIVDDASSDHTADVVKEFHDSRLQYLRNTENKGAPACRNRGIRQAKGEYVSLLDDDDEFLPKKIEKEIDKFDQVYSEVGVVYGGHSFVVCGQIAKTMLPQYRGDVSEITWRHPVSSLPSALTKRSLILKAGLFDESFVSCQDWDFWIRVAQLCSFDYIQEPLLKIYMHGGEISTNIQNRILGIERILNKYSAKYKERKKTYAIVLKRLGFLYFLKGDYSKGKGCFRKCFREDPFAFRNYIIFLLLLVPGRHHKLAIGKYAKLIHQIKDVVYF